MANRHDLESDIYDVRDMTRVCNILMDRLSGEMLAIKEHRPQLVEVMEQLEEHCVDALRFTPQQAEALANGLSK